MRLALLLALGLAAGPLAGQEAVRSEPIDLPTALRLAGAQSLDVQLAEARWREAQASADSTAWALFPTISPGVGYRKHSGQLQDIVGQVSDITKESVSAGATLGVSLELGEAVYRRLAAEAGRARGRPSVRSPASADRCSRPPPRISTSAVRIRPSPSSRTP